MRPVISVAPRREASRSRSPLHGPDPHNPPLTLGTIESHEYFSRWRPVLLMAQFHELCLVEEGRISVPGLQRREDQAISHTPNSWIVIN